MALSPFLLCNGLVFIFLALLCKSPFLFIFILSQQTSRIEVLSLSRNAHTGNLNKVRIGVQKYISISCIPVID